MSTSGSYNFSTSRNELIAGALRIVGAIAQGETPTAAQYTESAEALNMLVKAFMADGMPLWAITQYSLSLVAGTNTYTISSPKLLKVTQAFNHNSSTNIDIPMRVLTRQEYNILGNKTTTGNPIQLYHSPNRTDSTVKVFPTPDSTSATTNTITLVAQKPFEDFDASTDEPDFPQEWFVALKFALAIQLAPEYGMGYQDRVQLLKEAALYKSEALSFGTEEGSFYFQVDNRSW